jgi:hypothetical protein
VNGVALVSELAVLLFLLPGRLPVNNYFQRNKVELQNKKEAVKAASLKKYY